MEYKAVANRLYNRACYYLGRRERSTKEIFDYLTKKAVIYKLSPSETEEMRNYVIQKLQDLDMINDKRFMDLWVKQRLHLKPKGTYALKLELQAKGIDKNDIEDYFAEHMVDEYALSLELLKKKSSLFEALTGQQQMKKAINMLLRRGFSYNVSQKAFEEWKQKKYNKT